MKIKLVVLLILLSCVTTIWAPTCGGGPTGNIYYFDAIGNLGLPNTVSSTTTIGIYDLADNSTISAAEGYRCYSGEQCYVHPQSSTLFNSTKVLLKVNDSGSERTFVADMRYNGSGGLANCGAPVYRIENITSAMPSSPPYTQIFIALVLVVAICVGLYRMRKDVKKTNRKSKRD